MAKNSSKSMPRSAARRGDKLRLGIVITLVLTTYVFIAPVQAQCNRIVSLAPSVTEVFFELGLGDRVVAVTKFDHYPPQVEQLPNIGGFLDLNTELVVSLKPDLIVLLKEQESFAQRFAQLGLKTLSLEHRHIEGILNSISTVANFCKVEAAGIKKQAQLEDSLNQIKSRVSNLSQPRVAVVVARELGVGSIRSAFLSGNDGFYSDLVRVAGGQVAYQGTTVSLPGVSLEGLIALNPDIILDVVSEFQEQGLTIEQLQLDWKQAQQSSNLAHTRIVFLVDNFAQIPGPRFNLLLEKIAKAIHPEVFGESD